MIGIGVDIGGTYIKIAAVRPDGRLLRMISVPTEPQKGPVAFADKIAAVLNTWKTDLGKNIRSVGLGVAGDIDSSRGIMRFSPNLERWRNIPIVKMLKDKTGISCLLDNDANMAAWGAYAVELKKKYGNVITITLGTGVGCGIILGGEIFRGSTGSAGEIGHTKIFINGEPCHCGGRGCLEAYIGSYAISRRTKKALARAPKNSILKKICAENGHISTLLLTQAADKNDPAAKKIWADTGRYLGYGIASLALLFNPERIVLTGGVSRAMRHFAGTMKEVLSEQHITTPFEFMKIIMAKTADLGSFGAALYALEKTRLKMVDGKR